MTLKPASQRTKILAGISAVLTALAAAFWLATGVSFLVDQAEDRAVAVEDVSDAVVTKIPGATPKAVPVPVKPKGAWLDPDVLDARPPSTSRSLFADRETNLEVGRDAAKEGGAWIVAQVRPCRPGMTDVTDASVPSRWFHRELLGTACGTIYEETAHNFLADEGENDLIACFYRGASCPTAFTMSLLSTAASPAETSTWAALSSSELVTGTSPGYAAAALTRDATGWATLDTVASGTGGCTETSCARVSTQQVSITATGAWSVAARYITIRATVSAAQRHVATAQLSADRTLQNGDVLNLTYRQAMQ